METPIEDAYEKLLIQAEPRVVAEILFQVGHRPGAMPGRLPRVLVEAHQRLSNAEDPMRDGRSLLGALVEALARFRPHLSADAIATLASVDRREDGWPTAFRLALIADPERLAARVNETIEALDDEELSLFERYPEEIKRRVIQPREDKWPLIASQLGVPVDLKI